MKKILTLLVLVLLVSNIYAGGRGSGRHKTYGFSFSPSRALGIQTMKQRIARATGIPTTKQGRRAKVGRLLGIK
jgi:hypothetical protein